MAAQMIRLGEALRQQEISMQTQYASRYLTGLSGVQLGEGLQVDLAGYENGGDYHAILIDAEDAAIFAERLRAHQLATNQV